MEQNIEKFITKRTFFRKGDLVQTKDNKIYMYHSTKGFSISILSDIENLKTFEFDRSINGPLRFANNFNPGMIHISKK